MLDNDSWDLHYNLTIGLYDAASEALYVTGDFSRLAALVETPLQYARCFEDKLNLYNNLIRSFLASGQLDQGIVTCMNVLAHLGEVLPAQITPDVFHSEVVRVKSILDGLSNDQLLSLPVMTDTNKLVSIVLLSPGSCYFLLSLKLSPCICTGYHAILESSVVSSLCGQTCNGPHRCIQNA